MHQGFFLKSLSAGNEEGRSAGILIHVRFLTTCKWKIWEKGRNPSAAYCGRWCIYLCTLCRHKRISFWYMLQVLVHSAVFSADLGSLAISAFLTEQPKNLAFSAWRSSSDVSNIVRFTYIYLFTHIIIFNW